MAYIHYDPINDPTIHGDHPGALPHLHHKVEKGVISPAQTKWIWKVFWIMLIITVIELIVGFQKDAWSLDANFIKVFFIALTLVKAYYIVYSFMHLKDENRPLRYSIIYPFLMLIVYLVFIALTEGAYSQKYKHGMDPILLKTAKHGASHDAGGHGDGHKEGGEHH